MNLYLSSKVSQMYQVKYSQLSLPDLHDCVFSHQLRFVYIIIIISADHGNGVSSFVQIIHSYFLILLYLDIFLFIKFFPPQVQHGNSSRCFEVLFFSVYYYHSVITSVVLVLSRLFLFFSAMQDGSLLYLVTLTVLQHFGPVEIKQITMPILSFRINYV